MIQVILPLSFVVGAISMSKEASSMRLIVFPRPFEYRAVSMDHSASTICHIVLPISLIDGAVLPGLHTSTMSFPVGPFAFEFTPIWQLDEGLLSFRNTTGLIFPVVLGEFE